MILLSLLLLISAFARFGESALQQRSGRIEGRALPLPQRPLQPEVKAEAIRLFRPGEREKSAEAVVAPDGRFLFEIAPAGPVLLLPVFSVGQARGVTLPAQMLDALVSHDRTTDVALFGKGRPVTGRVELPGGVERERVRVSLNHAAPPVRAMRDPGRDGRPNPLPRLYERIREGRSLEAPVDRSGRFRIEGVREGRYRVSARIEEDAGARLSFLEKVEKGYPDVEHGKLRVYAMPGGETDTPLDLGTLRFTRP